MDIETSGLVRSSEKTVGGLSEVEIETICSEAYRFIKAQPAEETLFGVVAYDPRAEMMLAIEEVDSTIGKRFDAHGISKGSMNDQVQALDQLLTHGIDPTRPFHSMPLKGAEEAATAFGAAGPYEGSFMVLSEPDKSLKDGIGFVIVNQPFENSLPLLNERFPRVKFVPIRSISQKLGEGL